MSMKQRFRTQYDDDYNASIFFTDAGEDEGLVQQHMRDECDVNVIMARYQATGELQHIGGMAGEYGDFSDVVDYKTGLERIMEADALFMELPAKIRDQFNNDPAKFVEFATNADNQDKLIEMGLAPPRPEAPEPTIVKVLKDEDGGSPPSKKPGTGDQ